MFWYFDIDRGNQTNFSFNEYAAKEYVMDINKTFDIIFHCNINVRVKDHYNSGFVMDVTK